MVAALFVSTVGVAIAYLSYIKEANGERSTSGKNSPIIEGSSNVTINN